MLIVLSLPTKGRPIVGKMRAKLNHSRICSNTGVPRNSQTYSHATPLVTGLWDRRMTAKMTPRNSVSSIVSRKPLRIVELAKYCRKIAQSI